MRLTLRRAMLLTQQTKTLFNVLTVTFLLGLLFYFLQNSF
jgi:hypothetical protein